jgi:hypothetical protein
MREGFWLENVKEKKTPFGYYRNKRNYDIKMNLK